MNIGNQIKTLRLRRGVTQEAMALQLGITAQAVSKWETGASEPDISLLPAISAYFGVSIDELFALSDETRIERIENMLHYQRDVEPAIADREADFLLEKARREPGDPRIYSLLAWMENHRADTHRRRGAQYAKVSLAQQADNQEALNWLAYSHQLLGPYWTLADSHKEIIDYLTELLEKHPAASAAYFWLIDALLKDDRFTQAMEVCDKWGKLEHTCQIPYCRGLITWRSGDRVGALKLWEQMVRDFPDSDTAWGLYAEGYVLTGDYAGALEMLEKAKALQPEPSTTYWEMGALYRELAGDISGAISSLEQMLILMASQGQTEGAWVETVHRELARLKRKLTP